MSRIIIPRLRIEEGIHDMPYRGRHTRIVGDVDLLAQRFTVQALVDDYPRSRNADREFLDHLVKDTVERLTRDVSGRINRELRDSFHDLLNGPRTTTFGAR